MCACAPLLMLAGIGQAAVVDIGLNLSGSGSHTLGIPKTGQFGFIAGRCEREGGVQTSINVCFDLFELRT